MSKSKNPAMPPPFMKRTDRSEKMKEKITPKKMHKRGG